MSETAKAQTNRRHGRVGLKRRSLSTGSTLAREERLPTNFGNNTAPSSVASGIDPNTAIYNQGGPADITLAGGPSPFGTVGQAGNVWEWEETEVDLLNDDPHANRGFRGYAWFSISGNPIGLSSSGRHCILLPSNVGSDLGFRVASRIPEPSTLLLSAFAMVGLLMRRKLLRKPSCI